ncbi:RDD family protein [Sediminibacillus dalangtanensis]|uniref:RDD family protein n=1 Tax=Sediminibacillus dalangtanensis TaxID=2729421 RepID=A0ABX7VN16_9BACI|nr:RDD family protein [Sediminibacillus dalangtanensis]QTM98222.1 RDD family protein [Sediminibacillus dalangtanensis]
MERDTAGFGIRLLARLLDALILIFFSGFLLYVLKGGFSIGSMSGVTWQLVYTFYFTVTPVVWSGYVIGKRICKIKVKRVDGKRVTVSNMILREVVGYFLLGIITFGISTLITAVMVLVLKNNRGIHDFVGGTYVTYA